MALQDLSSEGTSMDSSALAILAANAASSAASMYNNQQNIKYASQVNDESVELANTAHQREIRDLQAAGLNPILSASGNGAATPQLKTPELSSIDGGIANSGESLGKAINGLTRAEVSRAKSEASSAASVADMDNVDAAVRVRQGFNDRVAEAAKTEAFTGRVDPQIDSVIDTRQARKAYDDLVQQYRNEAQSGRYGSSVERAVIKDLLEGATSAGQAYRTMKGSRRR